MPVDRIAIIEKRQRRRRLFRRFAITVGVITLCIGVLGLFYFLSSLGPRMVDPSTVNQERSDIPDETRELLERSRDLEAEFEAMLTLRPPDEESLAVLRQAIDLQRLYADRVPTTDTEARTRLDAMRTRYHTIAAEQVHEESVALENQADRFLVQRNYSEAAPIFSHAAQLQQKINSEYSLSPLVNRARETRLLRSARFAGAHPLRDESVALEEQAREAIAEERWDEASTALQSAIRLQEQINREFSGSPLASVARAESLRAELVAIDTGEEHRAITETVGQAQARLEEEAFEEAAALFQEARRRQANLNDRFPGSPHASSDRVNELEKKRQTALSTQLHRSIVERDEDLTAALRASNHSEARSIITRLRGDLETLARSYPQSEHISEARDLRIRYLSLVAENFGTIHTQVFENLIPLPDHSDIRMLRTEVNQRLYEMVMAVNPSRNRGDALPVESVSWNEAREYCQRLSWILGREVRLPTEEEFRNALGPLRYLELEDFAWGRENSEMSTQAIAQKSAHTEGFHDLLGNVAEWLRDPPADRPTLAKNIGGHSQDSHNDLFTVPVRTAPPNERNRLIGFRFVVLD